MKKSRTIFTIFLFFIIVIVFGFLYIIGFLNFFNSHYLKNIKFFDFTFLPKYITVAYLIILTFFLTLVFILILKILKITKEEINNLTAINVDDYSIKPEEEQDLPLTYSKLIDTLDKKISALKKYTELLDYDMEKVEKKNFEIILQKTLDSIYQNISHMITDIITSNSVSELFDKILYWSVTLSNSRRGSLMVLNKTRELYIYKTIGWNEDELNKYGKIKIPLGEGIAGKVASENKRIFVTNIEDYEEFDFKNKDKYETKSFISMPIFGIKNVIAVLNLTENRDGLYTINDLEIVNLITKLATKIFELIQLKKRIKE